MDNYITFVVDENSDKMLCKAFLKSKCNVSSRMITKLVRTEMGITRNNTLLKTIDYVNAGDIIKIKLPKDKNEIIPVKGILNILYEDDNLLIVDKPPQMPVHPTKNHQEDTLANIVRYYALSKGEDFTFRAINRIDRDTSGIVVIGKDSYTTSNLNGMYKEYTAICQGVILKDGTINKKIKLRDDSKMVREVNDKGANAITHYKIIGKNNDHTVVLCTLETGRTHQIRCHMSYLGYPLAGDELYGGSHKYISRQALHCSQVVFSHPLTKKVITVNSPLPNDMKKLLNIDTKNICDKI
jgi:23S rRNA pseudouridine1911/1915/1917 synthase